MATDIEWLAQETGLSEEQLKSLAEVTSKAEFKTMIAKLQGAKDAATAAAAKAEEDRLALEKQWSDVYQPELRKVTQDALAATGREAKLKAELEQARKYGIVPPEDTAAPPAEVRAPGSPDPNYVSRDEWSKLQDQAGTGLARMNDLNAEHYKLFGTPVPNMTELIEEVARERKLGRSADLRTAWEKSHNVSAKRAEMAAADAKKHDDEIRSQTLKEIAEKNGNNPNLGIGRPSRFSTYDPSKMTDNTKPWQRPHELRRQGNSPWRDSAIQKLTDAAIRGS
jgi:multidrug efflux pump subunit AcrA (membrane-fusion protein)